MREQEVVKLQSETVVGFVRDSRKIYRFFRVARARVAIKQYVEANPVRKLQIGTAVSGPGGWLIADIDPQSSDCIYLDATRTFPIPDQTFDYIYSEHMIEHISWHDGLFMLSECRRILKPGGVIRVATPDLAILIGLYGENRSSSGDRYIKWIMDAAIGDITEYRASFVVNNAFRNWGHQFLYDRELLDMAMREAGFTGIVRCQPGQSSHDSLQGIDQRHCSSNALSAEMNVFETMVLEGIRPR